MNRDEYPPIETRVRLKARTISGWKGTATMAATTAPITPVRSPKIAAGPYGGAATGPRSLRYRYVARKPPPIASAQQARFAQLSSGMPDAAPNAAPAIKDGLK